MLIALLTNSSPALGDADPAEELAPNVARIGTQAPDFTTEEAFGDTVTLSGELKDHNVILLSYRVIF